MFIWFLAIVLTYHNDWPRPFDDWKNLLFYMGSGFFLFHYLWVNRHKPFEVKKNPFFFLLFLYFTLAFLSLFQESLSVYEGLVEIFRLFLWVGLAFVFSTLPIPKVEQLIKQITLLAGLISLTTLLDAHLFQIWPKVGENFIYPIGHISYYGDYIAIHLPLALYLLITSKSLKLKVAWSLSFVVLFLALWHSATRASAVGAFAGIIFLLILLKYLGTLSWKKLATTFLLLVGFVSLVSLTSPSVKREASLLERLKPVVSSRSIQELKVSAMDRWSTYVVTWDMIRERPLLGYGVSHFQYVYPKYVSKEYVHGVKSEFFMMHPHNEILHQGSQLGFLGMFVFVAFIFLVYFYGMRFALKSVDKKQSGLTVVVALSAFLVAFVSWQFSTNFLHPITRLLSALFMGIVFSQFQFSSFKKQILFRKLYACGLVLTLLATLALGAYYGSLYLTTLHGKPNNPQKLLEQRRWAYYLAPGAFRQAYPYAVSLLQSNDKEEMISVFEKLYQHYPYVPFVLYQMAQFEFKLNNVEQAKAYLKEAIHYAPRFKMAWEFLERLDPTIKQPPEN